MTAAAFLEMAAIDPSFIERGKDIWLRNQQSPGMDQMAERAREDLLNAGLIPESQLTDEERQRIAQAQAEAANQPQQEDPMMVAARAEEQKALAEQMNAQNKQAEIQGNFQIKQQDQQLQLMDLQLQKQKFEREGQAKFNTDLINAQQNQQKIDLQADKQASEQQAQQFQTMLDTMKQQQDSFSQAVNDLKVLREAMGIDSIVGPTNTKAYVEQADIVLDKQNKS